MFYLKAGSVLPCVSGIATFPGDKISGLEPDVAAELEGAEPAVVPIGVPAGAPGLSTAV